MKTDSEGIRLNKFIAMRLSLGRRAADELITKGAVRVNNELPVLGARVHPGDEIAVRGTRLSFDDTPAFTYVAFHKPTGYVCSRRQQGETPTIYSLLPQQYQSLKPVGRLDKDTSGLLLLTNDGTLAHQLTHPRFAKRKQYIVTLDQPLQPLHHQMVNDIGVTLPDGLSKLNLERLDGQDAHSWRITMFEGRNRQIRRTFAALGYTVVRLHRTAFGNVQLGDLASGAFQLCPEVARHTTKE